MSIDPQMRIASDPAPAERSPVTFLSLTLGTSLCCLATVAGSYARFVLHTTRLDQNHLSMAAVVPLVLIAAFFARPFRISRGEMLVIFSMTLIGATMPTYFIGKLIANITVPYYLATPENQWASYFSSDLPSYAVLERGLALEWFFEGLPRGTSIPWGAWLVPVFWWVTVIAAFYGCCLCLMVVLRKQWMENERVEYPLMEMPLAVVEESSGRGWLRIPVTRSSLFWLGFGIPMFMILWNIGSYFSPTFPTISWKFPDMSFGRQFPPIRMLLYPMIVGFSYFIKLDILLSLWLFNLLTNLEMGTINRLGYLAGADEEYSTKPLPVAAQTMGAFLVMVSVGFWMARHHLKDVYRKAFYGAEDVDDSDEVISYRTAVFGFLACAAYLMVWHYRTGMELKFIPLFLLGCLVMYLGITRVIAETGLIALRAPLMPQPFALFLMGSDVLTQRTMVSVALSYTWCSDTKTTIMPSLAHSLRLFDTLKGHRRPLLGAVLLAMAAGVAASFIYTIHAGYETGAANYGGIFTGGLAQFPWDNLVKKAKEPFGIQWKPVGFMGIGAIITGLLMTVRYRYPAWPLHPVGFAAGPVIPANYLLLSFLAAWFIKRAILSIGGIRGFRAGKPFFIGLILGHFMGAGISFVVDMIWFPGQGHGIPFSD